MRIYPIKIFGNKILPKVAKSAHIVKQTAIGAALCTSAFLTSSCLCEYVPPQKNGTYINTENVPDCEDVILPDTVSRAIIQDIGNVHERINVIFQSLNITKSGKDIQDIKSIEFEDADGNKYNYTNIKKTDAGYEFYGTVSHDASTDSTVLKLYDAYDLVERPLVCMETSFNKKHNFSMLYQQRWRKGEDGKPERRLFQNRTNKPVEVFNKKEYYPYDAYNVFALRRTKDGISSKIVNDKNQYTPNDEIKSLNVVYK